MDFRAAAQILETQVENVRKGRISEASSQISELVRIPAKDGTTSTRKSAADIIRGTRKAAAKPGKHQWIANHMLSKLYKQAGAPKKAKSAHAKAHADTIAADEALASPGEARLYAMKRAAALSAAGKTKDKRPFAGVPSLPASKTSKLEALSAKIEAVKTKLRWLKRNPNNGQ